MSNNTFVTLKEIARAALPHLIDNLVFPRLVHDDFSEGFAAKQGDTIQVRKPVNYVACDFDAENGVEVQNVTEESVDVKLDKIATVDIEVSAIDGALNFDSVERLFIKPAAIALAEKVNKDGLALYKDVYNALGEAGKTPSTLEELSAVRGALNKAKAPQSPRYAVWDNAADTAFTTIPALVNAEKAGTSNALREGAIGKVFGVEHYTSGAVCKHETAITDATDVKLSAATNEGDGTLSLKGASLAGKLTKGDLMMIGEKTYTVTEDTADAASNTIAGVKVSRVRDYQTGKIVSADGAQSETGLPSSDVLYYELETGDAVIVRPSGTEPKIKVYLLAKGETESCVLTKLDQYAVDMKARLNA